MYKFHACNLKKMFCVQRGGTTESKFNLRKIMAGTGWASDHEENRFILGIP